MARIYAGVLGPLAMTATLIHGLLHAGSTNDVLFRSWMALCVFSVVGAIVGAVADRLVTEAVKEQMERELASQHGTSEGSKDETTNRSS
ncbi:hypothetical protein JCM19992_14410 [Thermostilla marina]